jgi:hypothetical protein
MVGKFAKMIRHKLRNLPDGAESPSVNLRVAASLPPPYRRRR